MREPVVAGQFYPSDSNALIVELRNCFMDIEVTPTNMLGAVVPHAGYSFSGSVAAEVYSKIPKAETYIIIGPNHTGYGEPVSLSMDTWITPLGEIKSDTELAENLTGSIIVEDELAHSLEHSIEVQLPFLQYIHDDFKILNICMGLQDEKSAINVGNAIAKAVKQTGKNVVIIASSDFTHYESAEVAYNNDKYLIEAVENLDVPEIYNRINELNISACGFGPIASMLTASTLLGAKKSRLIRYQTSGDIIGDMRSVVGYGAIIVE
ncbi:MEMO1 family protein [Methanosalsum natronophilum]|uniref:MEMO1 family protein D5R95_07140 n=1 Tax=Methanosalsum natronophilum TaxID=768733 RepID=A0A3R7VWU3_9EURY|nr:MAG: MEMO1 family protein [Methanosalsum natronophilum]